MATVTSVLAQGPGLPSGDPGRGLVLTICLTQQGQIDQTAYLADPLPWRVRRFWPDREDWHGDLMQVDGGWALQSERGDNEPLWDLQAKVLRPGEYITLRRPDGEELVFLIVNVEE